MSTFSTKASEYLVEEIGRRQELRDRLDTLVLNMPRKLTRTTWWLLSAIAISAACVLAAFTTTQAILSTRDAVRSMTTEHAREVVLSEWKPTDERCSAAFRLRNSAYASIEALRAASRSSDPKLSGQAKAWLDQVKELADR